MPDARYWRTPIGEPESWVPAEYLVALDCGATDRRLSNVPPGTETWCVEHHDPARVVSAERSGEYALIPLDCGHVRYWSRADAIRDGELLCGDCYDLALAADAGPAT